MGPAVQLIFFSILLSATISYALWVRWRVWILRQDLFAIRDRLWDSMYAKRALADPDYMACRHDINGMIKVAPALSLFSFLKFLDMGVHEHDPQVSQGEHLPDEVVAARRAVFIRVAKFMLFESLAGLSIAGIALLFGFSGVLRKFLVSRIQKFFDSREIREIGRQFEASGHLVSSF